MTRAINYDTPRIIVMHEWPGMPDTLKVGDVLTRDYMLRMPDKDPVIVFKHSKSLTCIPAYEVDRTIASGSNCLKQLAWWQERGLKDLPKYVKTDFDSHTAILKINEWLNDEKEPYFKLYNISPYERLVRDISRCQPSTKEQYEAYIQSKSNAK